jgi:hypothetical protein
MSQTAVANTAGVLSAVLTLAGTTGITAADISGFVTVVGALIAAVCFIWSHISHTKAVAAAQGIHQDPSLCVAQKPQCPSARGFLLSATCLAATHPAEARESGAEQGQGRRLGSGR